MSRLKHTVTVGAAEEASRPERALIHRMLVQLGLDKGMSVEAFQAGERIELKTEDERNAVVLLLRKLSLEG